MDSSNNDAPYSKKKEHFWAFAGGGLIVIGLVILLGFVLLWPHKPQFMIQDTTVIFGLNFSNPNLLASNVQVTLSTRNPNAHTAIYFEKLYVRALYRKQQITLATQLPSTYLDHRELSVWSPFLYGKDVPISPLLADSLMADFNSGSVQLGIKIIGRLKWKIIGTLMSPRYQLVVNCQAYVPLRSPDKLDSAVKYRFDQLCEVLVN